MKFPSLSKSSIGVTCFQRSDDVMEVAADVNSSNKHSGEPPSADRQHYCSAHNYVLRQKSVETSNDQTTTSQMCSVLWGPEPSWADRTRPSVHTFSWVSWQHPGRWRSSYISSETGLSVCCFADSWHWLTDTGHGFKAHAESGVANVPVPPQHQTTLDTQMRHKAQRQGDVFKCCLVTRWHSRSGQLSSLSSRLSRYTEHVQTVRWRYLYFPFKYFFRDVLWIFRTAPQFIFLSSKCENYSHGVQEHIWDGHNWQSNPVIHFHIHSTLSFRRPAA